MSIQKRTRNGKTRWVARYRDPAGREHSKTFDTRREAHEHLTAQQHAIRQGTWISPTKTTLTIHDLAVAWRDQATTIGTRKVRAALCKNLGDMADIPADRLPPSAVRGWVGHLQSGRPWKPGCTGVSHTYAVNLLWQLNAMLNQAVADEVIRRNPAGKIHLPTPATTVTYADIPTVDEISELERVAREGLTADEHKAALNRIGETRGKYPPVHPKPSIAVAIRLGAATGMRPGEICGLTWPAIDFERGAIHVSVQASHDGRDVRPLKTGESGKRTISIDADTLAMLEEHRKHFGAGPRVVLGLTGQPISANRLAAVVNDVRRLAGVRPTVTMKSLRHFHATALLQAGVPVKTVQHRLGHASAVMTLKVYAHFVPSDDVAAAGAIGGVLAGAGQVRDGRGRLRAV